MKRISPQVKKIADLHIQAKKEKKFDDPKVTTRDEIIQKLKEGKTFSEVMRQVEIRYCSITSIVMSSQLDYISDSYKSSVYKGFKTLLQ